MDQLESRRGWTGFSVRSVFAIMALRGADVRGNSGASANPRSSRSLSCANASPLGRRAANIRTEDRTSRERVVRNAAGTIASGDEIADCARTLIHRFGRDAPAVADQAADREMHHHRRAESAFLWRMIAADCRNILEEAGPE